VQRILAWLFAAAVLLPSEETLRAIARTASRAIAQIDASFAFSSRAIYNNHLVAEALGLVVLTLACPEIAGAAKHRRRGLEILDREAVRQFGPEGAYFAHSHNYARTTLSHL